jgi:hypothetical protein
MSAALVWGIVAVAGVLVAGTLFWIAGRVVHAEGVSYGRAIVSALFSGIVAAAVVAIVLILTDDDRGSRPELVFFTWWLGMILVMLSSVVILRNGFETSFPRASAVWCCAVGMAAGMAVLALPALRMLGEYLEGQSLAGLW